MSAALELNQFVALDFSMKQHSPMQAAGNGRRSKEEVVDSTAERRHLYNTIRSNCLHGLLVAAAFFIGKIRCVE